MRQVQAMLLAIGLAATACSGDSDTATSTDSAIEDESPTTTDAPAAPVRETVAAQTETEPASADTEAEPASAETEAEPASAETGDGTFNIETEVDFTSEPPGGTFVVDQGAELLGCGSGSVLEAGSQQGITNTFTCEDGDREGTFTFLWTIVEGSDGPGNVNGPWSVLDVTGDFAGLTGEGLWSGTGDAETGFGSFPGVVEFGPVGSASEPDPAIVADLSAYVEAFFTGDAGQAWGAVSERCKVVIEEVEHDGWVAEATLAAPGATVSNISTVVDGDTAAVSYYVFEESGQLYYSYFAQPWVLADGEWFQDNC